jgi:hypothetical protein
MRRLAEKLADFRKQESDYEQAEAAAGSRLLIRRPERPATK